MRKVQTDTSSLFLDCFQRVFVKPFYVVHTAERLLLIHSLHKMENIMATTIEWQCAHTVYIHLQKPTHPHILTHINTRSRTVRRAHTKECVSTIFLIHAWWKFANIYVLCSYAVNFIAFVCHITKRNFLPCELYKSCVLS